MSATQFAPARHLRLLSWLTSAIVLLSGCQTAEPTAPRQVPVAMFTAPEPVVTAVDEIFVPVEDESDDITTDIPPVPRMKPPLPRRLIAKLPSQPKPAVQNPAPPKPKPALAAIKEDVEGRAVDPNALVGSDYSGVLQILRKPDAVDEAMLPVVWTYSQTDCTLHLFFYPDIQTTTFRMLKYDVRDAAGAKLSDGGPCMRYLVR